MLLYTLSYLLLSCGITHRRDKNILYLRVTICLFLYSIIQNSFSLFFLETNKGIGLYSGLFNITSNNIYFHLFILLSILLFLSLISFYPGKYTSYIFKFFNNSEPYKYVQQFKLLLAIMSLIVISSWSFNYRLGSEVVYQYLHLNISIFILVLPLFIYSSLVIKGMQLFIYKYIFCSLDCIGLNNISFFNINHNINFFIFIYFIIVLLIYTYKYRIYIYCDALYLYIQHFHLIIMLVVIFTRIFVYLYFFIQYNDINLIYLSYNYLFNLDIFHIPYILTMNDSSSGVPIGVPGSSGSPTGSSRPIEPIELSNRSQDDLIVVTASKTDLLSSRPGGAGAYLEKGKFSKPTETGLMHASKVKFTKEESVNFNRNYNMNFTKDECNYVISVLESRRQKILDDWMMMYLYSERSEPVDRDPYLTEMGLHCPKLGRLSHIGRETTHPHIFRFHMLMAKSYNPQYGENELPKLINNKGIISPSSIDRIKQFRDNQAI